MVNTLWADVAEFQPVVDDTYPHRWFSFRCNDGSYVDAHFHQNYGWAQHGIRSGKLDAFIVYTVYEPGGAWVDTLMHQIGTPDPHMVVMVDVEAWVINGVPRIKGDHSADINKGVARIEKWLGNAARVIGYGNESDLASIWPHRTVRVVVGAPGYNPNVPGKIAHQYTWTGDCAPFGKCDLNSADGISSTDLATLLGVAQQEEDMTPEQAQQLVDVHKAVVEASITSPGGPQASWTLGHHTAFQSATVAAEKVALANLANLTLTPEQIDSIATSLGNTLTSVLGADVVKALAAKLAA